MKLELKHLAPYLPYGLRLKFISKFNIDKLSNENIVILKTIDEGKISINGYKTNNTAYKPILRPLSDLTKEIEVNGEKFVPIDWIDKNHNANNYATCAIMLDSTIELGFYKDFQKLFEWHFDVFGLIEKGLAIDINTLNQ